jgi:DNA-binding transcriptional regulator YiaG
MPNHALAGISPTQAAENFEKTRILLEVNLLESLHENFSKLSIDDKREKETLVFLVRALLQSNFDQQELARHIGVSRMSISRWASGDNLPQNPKYRGLMVDEFLSLIKYTIDGPLKNHRSILKVVKETEPSS